ncbi:unnamed protein product [Adineta steineri]|uniref:Uncharacterized protein n=1 Tax=Adineta steineri TaxID=433720 RepID=A0A818SW18_9BILA|nr:unnamed protein product [Adineta steineri]
MIATTNYARINWITCVALAILGLSISTIVILSLIPVYLEDDSTNKTTTTTTTTTKAPTGKRSVYIARDLAFTFKNSPAKHKRSLQNTNSVFVPTSLMIKSIQNELNIVLNDISAECIITNATMASENHLILALQIYFHKKYLISYVSRAELIKQVLTKYESLIIYKQYYDDCKKNPITIDQTVMMLQANSNRFYKISGPIQKPIDSINQQTDACQPTQATTAEPRKCIQMVSDEFKYTIQGDYSSDYKYYCFDWKVTKKWNTFLLSFEFNTGNQNYVYIDDVTFNSTLNLIKNGDFEIINDHVWKCPGTCYLDYVKDNPKSGQLSFRAYGKFSLTQLVPKPIGGDDNELYHFGFWLKLNCTTINPCTIITNINTPVLV